MHVNRSAYLSNLQGVGALVTGGASGLGRATVERLLKQGANVVLADLPNSDGPNVVKDLKNAIFAPVDVSIDDIVHAQEFVLIDHLSLFLFSGNAGERCSRGSQSWREKV